MSIDLDNMSLEGAQVGQLLEAADLLTRIPHICLQLYLMFEDVKGQQPDSNQQILPTTN